MGFQTPLYELSDYLKWTTEGRIQLPDFQRGYKWEEERIRSLLVTVLRGHPLGVVMLLKTGNDQIRFKPRPIEGAQVHVDVKPDLLLLDGQQRLTSLTQALTGKGVVHTMDSRGKLLERRFYVDMALALQGEDRIDEAVFAVPADGVVRTNFGKDVVLDLSTDALERTHGAFPLCLIFGDYVSWLFAMDDKDLASRFHQQLLKPTGTYNIPAIELDRSTSKSAVATVFEKVNTGGLSLNVFELLTATFAGDRDYFLRNGTDFRLNDDWKETRIKFSAYPVLAAVESTDFLQAVTMLATWRRNRNHVGPRPPAVSAKREDVLKLTLSDYLEWVGPLREAFIWASDFLADRCIYDVKFLPYPKQLVPLAAIRVLMGHDADLLGPREKIVRWFWCGILGELYGGSIENQFVRDLDQVPPWATGSDDADVPRTIQDATFVESRLHSLRTRNAAAYKGIYALLLANEARDWMEDKALDKVQYTSLAVDIHHVFPQAWCAQEGIDDERRESIVNKTAISATTNRAIGGAAPSAYLSVIERRAQISPDRLDALLEAHLVPAQLLRHDDFDGYFAQRRELLCRLVEVAMGKAVPRDVDDGVAEETSADFELEMIAEPVGEGN
ncbi:MAG: GmrSD restriction endonuclease domain-containing protein [Dermatophilaceae bacterium]